MSAAITDADRAAAHAANHPLTPGVCRSPHACERCAQVIADAREAENRDCEVIARASAEQNETLARAAQARGTRGSGAARRQHVSLAIANAIAARRLR